MQLCRYNGHVEFSVNMTMVTQVEHADLTITLFQNLKVMAQCFNHYMNKVLQ